MPNLDIDLMKISLPVALVFLFTSVCGGREGTVMSTASSAEQTTRQTPSRVPELKTGTYHGCESVPSNKFFQRLFLGFEFTGESCSVTVVSGNNVTVSCIEDEIVSLAPYPAPDGNSYSDVFIGELNNSNVLVVQHAFSGHVRSVTQTIRDSNGILVYGRSGKGDMIKECVIHQDNQQRLCQ